MENAQNQKPEMPQQTQQVGFNFDVIKQNIVYMVEKSYSCGAFKMDEVPAVIELKNTLLFFADEKKRQDEEANVSASTIATHEATITELKEIIAKQSEELAEIKAKPSMDVVRDSDAPEPQKKKAKKAKDVNNIDVKDPQFESNHVQH